MIKIIENIITKKEQEEIKNILLGDNFPWYFTKDITNGKSENNQGRMAFKHFYFFEQNINSSAYEKILPIVKNCLKKLNVIKYDMIEARSFLQLPLNKEIIGDQIDTPHIDKSFKHTVFLYYVLDSDGETILFDKKEKRIKPKQGRVVIFDGDIEHTAIQPEKNARCIINFNVVLKDI